MNERIGAMTFKELQERARVVLSALETIPVSGMRNVQNMSGCMTILSEVVNAKEEAADTAE